MISHGYQRLFFRFEDIAVAILADKALGRMQPTVKYNLPLPRSSIQQSLVAGREHRSSQGGYSEEGYAHCHVSHGYLQVIGYARIFLLTFFTSAVPVRVIATTSSSFILFNMSATPSA